MVAKVSEKKVYLSSIRQREDMLPSTATALGAVIAGYTLRRQTFPCDQFHLLAETVQLIQRGVNVGRDAHPLELFVHDRHGKDVVFVEQIFRHCFGISAVDVNISNRARLFGIERSVEP